MPNPAIRQEDTKSQISGRLRRLSASVETTVDISVAAGEIDVAAGKLNLFLEKPDGGTPLGPFAVSLEGDGTDGRWIFETASAIFQDQPTGRWGAQLKAEFVDGTILWTDYEYFRVGPVAT